MKVPSNRSTCLVATEASEGAEPSGPMRVSTETGLREMGPKKETKNRSTTIIDNKPHLADCQRRKSELHEISLGCTAVQDECSLRRKGQLEHQGLYGRLVKTSRC